jgi:hypothetical protein
MPLRAVPTAAVIALLALAPSPLAAQSDSTTGRLVGTVVDLDGRPLGGVEVTLLPAALRRTTSDSGRFTFRAVPAGWYVALLRRIGSRPVTFDVEVRPGGETRVRYAMPRLGRLLDTVVVTARETPRHLREFEWRRKTGGHACEYRVVLDGNALPAGTAVNFITPKDRAGTEVYDGPATTPLEYRPSGGAYGGGCCVILLWTRYGL